MSVPIHKPVVDHHGVWAEHDVACPVCRNQKAVLVMDTDVFQPCWGCQMKDWRTAMIPWWLRWLV